MATTQIVAGAVLEQRGLSAYGTKGMNFIGHGLGLLLTLSGHLGGTIMQIRYAGRCEICLAYNLWYGNDLP